jgi:hypothetical protein
LAVEEGNARTPMRLFGNIKGGGRVAGVLKLWKPEASINEK